MDQLEENEFGLDLSKYSKHELEVIKSEIEWLFSTKLYHFFKEACRSNRLSLLDQILETNLKGIESIFTRESIMGEAQTWKRVDAVFTELLEDINNTIQDNE